MTEKRFTFADGFKIVAIRDNGEIMNSKEVCNKLNELAEEKDYFERKKEYFLSKWSIAHAENIQLRQENEELKIKNDLLSDELGQAKAVIHKKWNEYLKRW